MIIVAIKSVGSMVVVKRLIVEADKPHEGDELLKASRIGNCSKRFF